MMTTGFSFTNATYPKRIHHKFVSIVRQVLRDDLSRAFTSNQIVKEQY